MIELNQLSLTYKQENTTVEVLRDLTLEIKSGESWVIIGPSGCGKSSLLYLLSGLIKPTSGSISISGEPINGPNPSTALILQEYGLFPWKTVWENATLGLGVRGVPRRAWKSTVSPILEELGLSEYKHHYPQQLSGGQRQRVAIARSLALSPEILLMDEPLSSLDALTRENLQNLLLKIWKDKKLTMLMVTHSIEEAVFLGQKILVFSPRPARLLANFENPKVGDPAYRSTPAFYTHCAEIRSILERGSSWREYKSC